MEKTKYQGKFISVTEEFIGKSNYERVYVKGAVIIFPIDDEGKILLIKEERPHESPSVRWKPVTGFIEPELSCIENAQKEMQEEIGFKAKEIEILHDLHHQGSINVRKCFVIAKGLVPSKIPNPDGEEVIKEVKSFSLDHIISKSLSGEIPIYFDSLGFFILKELKQNGKISIK